MIEYSSNTILSIDMLLYCQVLYRETATKCMVCEEQNRTVTLSPCNHYVVCSTCAPNQRECPYCQTPVVSTSQTRTFPQNSVVVTISASRSLKKKNEEAMAAADSERISCEQYQDFARTHIFTLSTVKKLRTRFLYRGKHVPARIRLIYRQSEYEYDRIFIGVILNYISRYTYTDIFVYIYIYIQ